MGNELAELISDNPGVEVWAAGGLILRPSRVGPEILVVHRPHRADWTFPKGKLDLGETLHECAIREVFEETGFECETGRRLSLVRYVDTKSRAKAVVYWTMHIGGGSFAPNREVDALGWFDFASATNTLSYNHDLDLLNEIDVSDISPTVAM